MRSSIISEADFVDPELFIDASVDPETSLAGSYPESSRFDFTVRLCRATEGGQNHSGARIGRSGAPGRGGAMIRKLKSGQYRLYSMKKNPKTGRRRNLGTFATRQAAQKHERAVQYFKRH